jgi:hypothetical protein
MSPRLPGARYSPVTVARVTSPSDRTLLRADCANCAGLCCVALAFTRSADFAIDKPAGDPCVNLLDDFRCDIHPTLRDRGFKGCTVFDCLGAGQRVTAAMGDWRGHDDRGAATFAVFVGLLTDQTLNFTNELVGLVAVGICVDDIIIAVGIITDAAVSCTVIACIAVGSAIATRVAVAKRVGAIISGPKLPITNLRVIRCPGRIT